LARAETGVVSATKFHDGQAISYSLRGSQNNVMLNRNKDTVQIDSKTSKMLFSKKMKKITSEDGLVVDLKGKNGGVKDVVSSLFGVIDSTQNLQGSHESLQYFSFKLGGTGVYWRSTVFLPPRFFQTVKDITSKQITELSSRGIKFLTVVSSDRSQLLIVLLPEALGVNVLSRPIRGVALPYKATISCLTEGFVYSKSFYRNSNLSLIRTKCEVVGGGAELDSALRLYKSKMLLDSIKF